MSLFSAFSEFHEAIGNILVQFFVFDAKSIFYSNFFFTKFYFYDKFFVSQFKSELNKANKVFPS